MQLAWGKKQRYATQTTKNDYTNTSFFQAIEDESNVHKRRIQMGIGQHVEDYAKISGFTYTVPSPEEAEKRASEFESSYFRNIDKAEEAFSNGDYRAAADFYIKASYSDGYMSKEEYVKLAKSVSKADYKEKAYWGYKALLIASLNGWEGIAEINSNPDLENLKKATPNNWIDLENTVNQLLEQQEN